MHFLTTELKIANIKLPHRLILAPMSGVSDLPFRQLAFENGASLITSEMVASNEFCKQSTESIVRATIVKNAVNSIQLLGCEAKVMAQAAVIAQKAGADIIDINMGCPAKKIITGQCGAALLRNISLAKEIIVAVLSSVIKPVSLKIRLGWDNINNDVLNLCRFAQEQGIVMLTVHARTRMQFYNDTADWYAAKKIRDAIQIPMVINGDIIDAKTAIDAVKISNADAVMIGRACYGAPWKIGEIYADLSNIKRNKIDIKTFILKHFEMMTQHYGEQFGINNFRKHLSNYIDNYAVNKTSAKSLLRENKKNNIKKMILELDFL